MGNARLEPAVAVGADDAGLAAQAAQALGVLQQLHGDNELACLVRPRLAVSALCRRHEVRSLALNSVASASIFAEGRLDDAEHHFMESVAVAVDAGDDGRVSAALSNLALARLGAGRPALAIVAMEEALAIDRALGDPWAVAVDEINLGAALIRVGDVENGWRVVAGTLPSVVELDDPDLLVLVLECAVTAAGAMGDSRRAILLVAGADRIRAEASVPRTPTDDALERELGPAPAAAFGRTTFDSLVMEGLGPRSRRADLAGSTLSFLGSIRRPLALRTKAGSGSGSWWFAWRLPVRLLPVVNVALPTLVRDLDAPSSQLQWIVDATPWYSPVCCSPPGRSVTATGEGCAHGGLACSGRLVVCALVEHRRRSHRATGGMGIGAAFMMPATLSILANVFPPKERGGRSDLGRLRRCRRGHRPAVGGFLIENFWWGSIFPVNVPSGRRADRGRLPVPTSKDRRTPPLDPSARCCRSSVWARWCTGSSKRRTTGWTRPDVGVFVVRGRLARRVRVVGTQRAEPMLDLSFFKNPRFTAARLRSRSCSSPCSVLYSFHPVLPVRARATTRCRTGIRILPWASPMVSAPSREVVERIGTKLVVATGLTPWHIALVLAVDAQVDSGYGRSCGRMVLHRRRHGPHDGAGDRVDHGVTPLTRPASVPRSTTRHARSVGHSVWPSSGRSPRRRTPRRSPAATPIDTVPQASPEAAAAMARLDRRGRGRSRRRPRPSSPPAITAAADAAFIDALGRTTIVAAVVALGRCGRRADLAPGPGRSPVSSSTSGSTRPASVELVVDAAAVHARSSREPGRATLQLLADAGMSSLSFAAISAESGVPTATLERHWTSKVDAVEDALVELFGRRLHPRHRATCGRTSTATSPTRARCSHTRAHER